MNWDGVKGQVKQVKGKIEEKCGRLTADDLALLEGEKEEFLGRVEARYGIARDEVERQLDQLLASMPSEADRAGRGIEGP